MQDMVEERKLGGNDRQHEILQLIHASSSAVRIRESLKGSVIYQHRYIRITSADIRIRSRESKLINRLLKEPEASLRDFMSVMLGIRGGILL